MALPVVFWEAGRWEYCPDSDADFTSTNNTQYVIKIEKYQANCRILSAPSGIESFKFGSDGSRLRNLQYDDIKVLLGLYF